MASFSPGGGPDRSRRRSGLAVGPFAVVGCTGVRWRRGRPGPVLGPCVGALGHHCRAFTNAVVHPRLLGYRQLVGWAAQRREQQRAAGRGRIGLPIAKLQITVASGSCLSCQPQKVFIKWWHRMHEEHFNVQRTSARCNDRVGVHLSRRRTAARGSQCRKSASSFSTISVWSFMIMWFASSTSSIRASGSCCRRRIAVFGPL
jgi:hypothetical protein